MKILLVHNFYGASSPSGENVVFLAEKELLQNNGHEVIEYTTQSDSLRRLGVLGSVIGAICVPLNFFNYVRVRKILDREKPDVMHVHNTFPLLSPAIFHAAKKTRTATVLTLHNYRLFCAAAIPMRNNKPCTLCLDKQSVWPAIRFRCYRKSRLATLPLAVMISLHRALRTWRNCVDAFISLTAFQKNLVVESGLPSGKVHIKPQFYPNPPTPLPWNERESRVVYIGRLSEEKGVKLLPEVWKKWGKGSPSLYIVGDGPLLSTLHNMVEQYGLSGKVKFLGAVSFEQTQTILSKSRLMIMPSLWFEGFPMVIREAFSLGTPVAASNLGSMPCIINDCKDGVLFQAGNSESIYQIVGRLWEDQNILEKMGKDAREEFEKKYTAGTNYNILMVIYRSAIQQKNVITNLSLLQKEV